MFYSTLRIVNSSAIIPTLATFYEELMKQAKILVVSGWWLIVDC
jgi:hypothetical protein